MHPHCDCRLCNDLDQPLLDEDLDDDQPLLDEDLDDDPPLPDPPSMTDQLVDLASYLPGNDCGDSMELALLLIFQAANEVIGRELSDFETFVSETFDHPQDHDLPAIAAQLHGLFARQI